MRTFRLDLPVDDIYVFRVRDETQADEPIPNGLTLRASQCRPCGDWVWADSDVDGSFPSIAGLDAGRYSVEITMPEDYVGAVRLEIDL